MKIVVKLSSQIKIVGSKLKLNCFEQIVIAVIFLLHRKYTVQLRLSAKRTHFLLTPKSRK